MEAPPKHPDVAIMFTKLLDVLDMNAAQFARKIGSTPQAVSNYLVGRNEPGRKMMALIINTFPAISASWLATGHGNPVTLGRSADERAPISKQFREAVKAELDAEESAEALTSGPATVDRATELMLRGHMEARIQGLESDKARLLKENGDLRDENRLLLGKPSDSTDAADDQDEAPLDPNAPTFAGGHAPRPRLRIRGLWRSAQEVAVLS